MSFILHTPASRKTINWASGTSTEIFIYPSDGSFADRNFLFRISTATVEAEESTFTFFGGITRHLMILKGQLELIHEGRYTKRLQAFDQDTFSGEWETRSKGKVTDFNLMLKDGATGWLKHHTLKPGQAASFTADTDYRFVYVASGQTSSADGLHAAAGDLIEMSKNALLQLSGEAELVEIAIMLN